MMKYDAYIENIFRFRASYYYMYAPQTYIIIILYVYYKCTIIYYIISYTVRWWRRRRRQMEICLQKDVVNLLFASNVCIFIHARMYACT